MITHAFTQMLDNGEMIKITYIKKANINFYLKKQQQQQKQNNNNIIH